MNDRERAKLISDYEVYCQNNGLDPQEFDINAEIDSTLDFNEAKNEILDKLAVCAQRTVSGKELKAQLQREQIENKNRTKSDLSRAFIKRTTENSRIMIVLGARNSGKTALGIHFLELHSRKKYIYKFPRADLLPDWIENIDSLDDADNNSVILLDEASTNLDQFSFNSKQSRLMADLIRKARHKGLSLIFVTQNGNMLTRDIRRLVDCYLLRKPSLSQIYEEKGLIRQLYEECAELFNSKTGSEKCYYAVDSEFRGDMDFELPDWWDDKISKAYAVDTKRFNSSSLVVKFIEGVKTGWREK